MRYGRYGYAHLLMRASLGIVFIWIGVDILRTPNSWTGFLPSTLPFGLDSALALKLNGAFDLGLGLVLLWGHWPKLAALLAGLHLAGIIVVHGIDAVIIRDVGLLGIALALFSWPYHRRRRWWWKNRTAHYEGPTED